MVVILAIATAACSKKSAPESGSIPNKPPDLKIELDPSQSLTVVIPGREDLTLRVVRRGDSLVSHVAAPVEDAPDLERRRIEFVAESDVRGSLQSHHFSRDPIGKLNLGLQRPSQGVVFVDVDGDGLPDYRSDAFGVYRATSIQWERIDADGEIPEVPVEVIQSVSGVPSE